MRRYILIVLLTFLTLGVAAQDVLTLDSCLVLARANNVQFKTNRIEIEKSKLVKKEVFTKYFPQVSANYIAYYAAKPLVKYGVDEFSSDEFGQIMKAIIDFLNNDMGLGVPSELEFMQGGNNISATAIQPLFAGGRIVYGNELAQLGIEAQELKAEVSERDVLENIESTYFLIVGLKSKVETLQTALTLIDSLDHVADVAFKAGLVTNNDKLRVALERNKYQALQMQLNNGIILASQLLCQEIGIEYPDGGLNLEDDIENDDLVVVENDNFERPEMRLLQLQVDAELLYKRITRGEALPTVGVGAMLSYGNMIQKNYTSNAILFARISLPLSQWWETSYKIKEHNLKIEQYEIMQKDLLEKMSLQEKQAYNQMIEAAALLKSDEAALDMAQENYRVAELNYRAGVNTVTDVLEANTLLLQAQNAITDRQITYVSARRRYHDLTGRL